MASTIETRAVALRKGDTASNRIFTGVLGEVTVDLGNEQNGVLGVDTNVTLRVHNGITPGGIPLARADTRNITTAALATNRHLFDDKNLAYADLSNMENTEDPEAIANIKTILTSYGMINDQQLEEEVSILALKDMSNVLTSTLASGRGRGTNGNLAYADTSNVNTADLASYELHNGAEEGDYPLSYADLSNVDTTNITLLESERPENINGPVVATNTFNNVPKESWQNALFDPDNELYLEQTLNKDEEISRDYNEIEHGNYPSSTAVYNFVETTLNEYGFLKNTFSNAKTYEPLYSNNEYKYNYVIPEQAIIKADDTNLVQWSAINTGILLNSQKELMTFTVIETKLNEVSKIEKVIPTIRFGAEKLENKIFTVVKPEGKMTVTVNSVEHTAPEQDTYYEYTVSLPGETDEATGLIGDIILPEEKVEVTPYFAITISAISTEGKLENFTISPNSGNIELNKTEFNIATNTSVKIDCKPIFETDLGGAGLAKTDLSNLLGMDSFDKIRESNSKWRIRHDENIPTVENETISDKEYYNISNNGKVWEALTHTKNYIEKTSGIPNWKPNTQYNLIPYPSKVLYNGDIYYCIKAHQSEEIFDITNWKLVSEDTYEKLINKNSDISLDLTSDIKYPTNSAVAKYVKEQIDAVHTPGHYYGQVDIFVPTEKELPTKGEPDPGEESESGLSGISGSGIIRKVGSRFSGLNLNANGEYDIEPYEGLTALVEKYTVSNKPVIATYTSDTWIFDEITLQNGIYVYVLDLGKSYYNGPGNATWNEEIQAFDIAPDKFQVPDGITLNLNSSTGAIQIVPELQTKLGYVDVSSSIQGSLDDIYDRLNNLDSSLVAMVIPNPQFFTGNGTLNQQLQLTDNVAFDLYVNGVFQYPNTYNFDTETKVLTLQFAVENQVENGIAVIYRGFRTLQN